MSAEFPYISKRTSRFVTAACCRAECDVNAGKFRKHGDCGEGSEDGNSWQIESLPVRASECDAFWEDCKNMVMCTCVGDECTGDLQGKSLFGMAVEGVCSNSTQFCQRTVKEVRACHCALLRATSLCCEVHATIKAASMHIEQCARLQAWPA